MNAKIPPLRGLGWLVLSACLLLVHPFARGAIMGTDSIEWLVCSSTVVAVGTIAEVKTVKGPEAVVYQNCVLNVSEMIKGQPEEKISFSYRYLSQGVDKWKAPGKELLVFLTVWKDHYTDERAQIWEIKDPSGDARMPRCLVLTSDRPKLVFSLMDLSDLQKSLFDKDMRRVTDREALLALCRTWAKANVKHPIREWVPADSEVWRDLYGGSAVFLEVPAEAKHHERFLKYAKSAEAGERAIAASELGKFPGEASETALRSLLDDKTEEIWISADTISEIRYRVRSAAHHSLRGLGKDVPDLPLEREPSAEEQRDHRHKTWRRRFEGALRDQTGWKVTAIRDGETRNFEKGPCVMMRLDLEKGEEHCTLTLVPKEFPRQKPPAGKYLGIDGPDSQGGRRFYVTGDAPVALVQRIVQYFGLERGKL